MKILVLSNLYPPHNVGGYEVRCQQVVHQLRQFGHEVRVLTSNHQVAGVETPPEPEVSRRLRIHGFFGHPWLPIHKLYALEKHNHAVLREELETFKPEVVHVWNMGGLSKSLLLRLEAGAVPVVYDVSDHWIARSLRADVWLAWWNRKQPLGGRCRGPAASVRDSGLAKSHGAHRELGGTEVATHLFLQSVPARADRGGRIPGGSRGSDLLRDRDAGLPP